ncbi:MAG: 7-cyano-7-deazaguanine synthase QueC [Bdellovibrionia bacterium]
MRKKAVLLLSGGLDSTTVLEIAKSEGFDVYALSFSYGQRHSIELEAVQRIIEKSPVKAHQVVKIDLRAFGGSALTADIDVPKNEAFPEDSAEIPVTYVPARNTIFLSFALGFAETIGAYDIFLGVNAIDYSNYPDCRPEFIECFERLANLATAAGVQDKGRFKIHAPLIKLTKAEIIKTGLALGVDYSVTNSCYDPSLKGEACGKCDACHLRIRGFEENGLKDPAPYIKSAE